MGLGDLPALGFKGSGRDDRHAGTRYDTALVATNFHRIMYLFIEFY